MVDNSLMLRFQLIFGKSVNCYCIQFSIRQSFYGNCNKVTIGQEKAAGVEKGMVYFPACLPLLSRLLRLQLLSSNEVMEIYEEN